MAGDTPRMERTGIRKTEGPLVVFEKVTVGSGNEKWLDAVDLTIQPGQQWAIVGPSGSGKTVLAHTLLGRHAHQGRIATGGPGIGSGDLGIAIVEQQHRFRNLYGTSDLYYQQRFNSYDAEQTITVREEFRDCGIVDGRGEVDAGEGAGGSRWIDELQIRHLLDKPLIQLSNGENRRVQLAIALSGEPALLILDNPFLGLDAEGRQTLHRIIDGLTEKGVTILLITSSREVSGTITHVAEMDRGRVVWQGTREAFLLRDTAREPAVGTPMAAGASGMGAGGLGAEFDFAVRMAGV
ncbi:MAG: ATP-binding cassette domain-containing protein, partial [Bacteroidota bacterium]|nr:ATP-binding cassette domain-containing protein [Bacteroidota bacterium]